MSLLRYLDPARTRPSRGPESPPAFTPHTGHELLCPYCRAAVPRVPRQKAICDRCGQTYFARVRPGETRSALVTARQAAAIDEAQATRPRVAVRPAAEPQDERPYSWVWAVSTAESQWHKLRKSLPLHQRDGNWLLYRNARFEMAEIRRRQGRFGEALEIYAEVWYLDLNGPHDCWGMSGVRRLYERAPFDPDAGFTTPVVARWVNRIAVKQDLDRRTLQRLFAEVTDHAWRTLSLPVTPREAWATVQVELVV